jgi:hypothetical protein
MSMKSILLLSLFAAVQVAQAASDPIGWQRPRPEPLKVSADQIAADNVMRTLVATGNVRAVSKPITLTSREVRREVDGAYRFGEPSSLTTCTNAVGCQHWSLNGEIEYRDYRYALGRNMVVKFWEIPMMWVPYWYYPLDTDYGLRVIPGYSSRWGAYLLTKYVYHVAGDPTGDEEKSSLRASTRLDLRSENGVALGQGFGWNLANFGKGKFKVYYAWDEDYDHYERNWMRADKWNYQNWGSTVERERYAFELSHRWEPTERDSIRLRGFTSSDSYFRRDFLRSSLFNIKSQWLSEYSNEIAWEHVENFGGFGVSASGPIDDFIGGTSRLPEFYFDVAPRPLFGLPINYETENRAGYLRRNYARYGSGVNLYSYNPGAWANYGTFRMDTYHRLTAPFRMADLVSVVPRFGWRGTYWGDSGNVVFDGMQRAGSTDDDIKRSIVEGGITFAGRGTAWIDDRWQHMVEPYLDFLAQKADYSGDGDRTRTYVFDSVDMARSWEGQFAGASRNLPHTYVGATPGLRNSWSTVDEKGNLRNVLDLDVYAALQFNDSEWYDPANLDRRQAKLGEPNYGDDSVVAAPGVRARWTPGDGMMLGVKAEYDSEYDEIALADITWRHRVTRAFSYYGNFSHRNHRWWDYSVSPYDPAQMRADSFNWAHFGIAEVGFEYELCDAWAFSPFLSWDTREDEMDEVGCWIDYRTDCLGFRFIMSYANEYTRVDGSKYDEEFNCGFFVYLRAFGPAGGDAFWK